MAFNYMSGSVVADSLVLSGALSPADSDLSALGSAAAEWSDLYLADGGVINLGDDQDITLTHVADTGVAMAGSHANGTNLRLNNTAADGDARVEFQLGGTTAWSVGVEDGDSDKFVIEDGAGALGADPAFEIAADKSAKFYGTLEAVTSFTIGSAALTEAELEKLDGITNGAAAANKAVVLDGNLDFDGMRNLTMDGSITAGANLSLDSGTTNINSAELNVLDSVSAGTAAASKAVVLGSSKEIATIGTIGCGAITSTGNSAFAQGTFSGRVIVDDATEATSTTDGSLQTDGGLSVAKSAVIGDDLDLLSDAAILSFGAGKDVTFTHDGSLGVDVLAAGDFNISGGAASYFETSKGDLTLKSAGDVILSGYQGDVQFADGGTNYLKLASDGNDAVWQVQQDSKHHIFKNYDGTELLKLHHGGHVIIDTHNGSDAGLYLGNALVTATAVELNYLDIAALGTSQASKAVTVNADGDLLVPDSDKYKFGAGGDMELYHDGTNSYLANKTGALKIATETSGIAVSIGHGTSEVTINDNLTVSGDLTVTGNTVTNQVEVISTSTGVLFEGGVDDGHEATLKSAVAGADVTYTLPNLTGHVPLLAGAASNANVTAAEFALLDGGSSIGTTAVSDGHGLFMNQGGTMAHTTVQTLAAYLDDEITSMPNLTTAAALVTVSALNAGSITSGFGSIDIGASALAAGSLDVSDGNITNVGSISLDSISADDGSSFSFGSNWTAASRTCANLGTVTTADINGGSMDGVTIGAASAAEATFTGLAAAYSGSVGASTVTYTAAATDFFIGVSGSSTVTISLPAAGTVGAGKMYVVKDVAGHSGTDGRNIVVEGNGSETIDGQLNVTLNSDYAALNFMSDGSNWAAW